MDISNQQQELFSNLQFFSIALGESTDSADTAQLLIFIRDITENFTIPEELISLESLHDRTTGVNIFNAVCQAFSSNSLNWANLIGVTTDGAKNMVGDEQGLIALLKKKMLTEFQKEITHYHNIIIQ